MKREEPKAHDEKTLNRRTFIRRATMGAVAAGSAGSLLPLLGCDGEQVANGSARPTPPIPPGNGPVREMHLAATIGEVELAPGHTYRTWLYDGEYPGPEIRVREGEQLRIHVENDLSEGTTVHWHGIPLPNEMDGVPGLTQDPIEPGDTFLYEFDAAPPGSYIYHSHMNLQLDRGLLGALIIEESTPHVDYDHEHTLILDDYLTDEPEPLDGRGMGMMGDQVPPYEGILINGKLPEAAPAFEAKQGERVRLRFVNASSASTYRVAIAEHPMQVTHADGQPVEPVEVDAFLIGMGERYDVIVEADNPGAWTIMAAAVEGDFPPARGILQYTDAARDDPPEDEIPEGLRQGRLLEYDDLQSVETLGTMGEPDRTFDLRLSREMMMRGGWAIDGQTYPDADPFDIREGEHVRVRMTNHSMMLHPMHLHGHFFRVGNAVKDTVLVPPRMGRVTFDFVADNPGDWLFHCHNIYHMESGMARIFRYADPT